MPSHEQNYQIWNNSYDWSRYQGDEWSAKWGGTDMQWYWTIYPRIRYHLPAQTILDIGPGQGRWTRYLLQHCDNMVLVDLSEKCINACRRRFGEDRVLYKVGSGDSIDFLEDESIDFAFSWETLVYAEIEAVRGYLEGLARKLKPDGRAFLHHSNLASYSAYFDLTIKMPKRLRDFLKTRGLLDYDQWRARSVTAELFARCAEEVGLRVTTQELIPWGGRRLIDCFTTLTRSSGGASPRFKKNPNYHTRAYHIQELSWLYGEGVPW